MWNNVRQLNLAASALYALLLLVLAAAGCYWLIQRPTFALREIRIDGDTEHINTPTVRAGVVGRLKGNFFTVDLDTARAAFEQMPWVRHASVRRVWPNALAVTLDKNSLLDPNGAILPLGPAIGLDGGLIGQFLMQMPIDLFARDLGRERTHRRIRHLIFGIVKRPFRYASRQRTAQIVNTVA